MTGMMIVRDSGACHEDDAKNLEYGVMCLQRQPANAVGLNETLQDAAPGYDGGTAVDTPLTQRTDTGRKFSDPRHAQVGYVHSNDLGTHSPR